MVITIINDSTVIIANLSLKGNFSFSMSLDDIQRLIAAKTKKIAVPIKNNLILEKRVIKKIWSNPNALNHK